jgi:hypothetical protein
MARQAELFPEPAVVVRPSGTRGEPRLWVRRLAIWENPGTILRDISLRRGLNIIWSPDPGVDSAIVGRGEGSGHGASKTLLCRLLRYCLGEDTFANDELRRSVAEQLPAGLVGIEVLINSVQWAVLRPIGTTRRQTVRSDTTLEELVESNDPSTGIQPLLEALDSLVLQGEGELFIPSSRAHSAWLFALAWMTRDQECRYDHILDWRHVRADTRSPVLGTSVDQRLVAARSLLGVLDQEEIRLKDERDDLAERRKSLERDLTYYQRRVDQLRADLSSVLGTQDNAAAGGELELGEWRAQAEARLAREDDNVQVDVQRADLAATRSERDGVLGKAAVVEDDLRRLDGTLALHQEQVRALRGERANLDATEIKARLGPVCPVCNVPIDRALAEGCAISTVLPDATAVAEEKRTVADQMRDCNTAIAACQTDIAARRADLAQLRQRQTDFEDRIAELEMEVDRLSRQNRQRWSGKQRVIENAAELQRTYDDVAQAKRDSGELATKDEQLRDRQTELRASHQDVLKRFDELFVYVCRGVLGNDISASVSLTGLGIQADVQVGGMAMESLKAIAFDLAATLMSMEGRTVVPAFLVHDSPREADLGVSIYHRWFRFIASLEKLSAEAPFQYIITTTSEPPEELRSSGFVIETLHGADPKERLLRRELGH